MSMKINHNIAAMNAWRNLGMSNTNMSSSLEKLSSGYRINRGADDPSGLLISETLRAQIGGIDQAIKNASDAVSMVQTAEGALNEINNMLNSVRSLAVHAANTGANDSSSIEADQTAVDKAIESISRIATTTKFVGKNLLQGGAGGVTGSAGTVTNVTVTAGSVDSTLRGNVDANIITAATKASATTAGITLTASGIMKITTTAGTVDIGTANGSQGTAANIIASINAHTASLGVVAASGATASTITLRSVGYGTAVYVKASFVAGLTAAKASATGGDIAGSINGTQVQGSGLVLYGSGGTWDATSITVVSATNTTGTISDVINIKQEDLALQFSLTDNAATNDLISYSIQSLKAVDIGNVTSTNVTNQTGLNGIITGGTYDLDSNSAGAVEIIDQAISDVSKLRSNLGAFQKFTLETTINNLGVTKENLVASESRIRDVDMADEMMNFTKNQILVQAGTAMLAQANQVPQTVLQLLG